MTELPERIAAAAVAQGVLPGTVVIVRVTPGGDVVARGAAFAEPRALWSRAVALCDANAGERPALAWVVPAGVDVFLDDPATSSPTAVRRS